MDRDDKKESSGHYSRRRFLGTLLGAGALILTGSWLFPRLFKGPEAKENGSSGGVGELENNLSPLPQPAPESDPPIGGGAKGEFAPFSVTEFPVFDNSNWSFKVDGLVEQLRQWDWGDFVKLKRQVRVSDFHCVTGWSVTQNTWEGIPLAEFLEQAQVKRDEARTVKFYSGDGVYTDTLTLEQAAMEDVIIAVLHDGKPISAQLGGPVRLVIPQMYGYKSVKWLTRIELIAGEHTGYWEQRGYARDAWVGK